MSAPATAAPVLSFVDVGKMKVNCDRLVLDNKEANVYNLPLVVDSNQFEWQVDPKRMYVDHEGGQYNKPRIIINLTTEERDAWQRFMGQCEKAVAKRLGNNYEFKSVLWPSKYASGTALELRMYPKKGFLLDTAEHHSETVKDLELIKGKELFKIKGEFFPWTRPFDTNGRNKETVYRCGMTLFLTEVHGM